MVAQDAWRMPAMIPRLLRGLAIAIVIAAIIDPAVPWTSREKPVVALVADDAGRALAEPIAERLDHAFTVVQGPFAGATATVFAGTRPPAALPDAARPAFVVLPEPTDPTITIASVRAPPTTQPRSRVPVAVTVRARGVRGRRVVVVLRDGVVAMDRASREITSDDELFDVLLSAAPAGAGPLPLRVTASLEGGERFLFASLVPIWAQANHGAASSAVSYADIMVDVRDEPWAVLFHDARASWKSTFVRRSIERDARFTVSSRVVTSPGISIDVGQPPSLEDAASLARFDVVVAGAPESLTEREVAGLDAYMRERGGSVVLLLDRSQRGAYDSLTGGVAWSTAANDAGHSIRTAAGDTSTLVATEIAWPARLPAGATALAFSAASHPVVWRAPAGAGRLVVSGALDAWRHRDPARSSFDAFWRAILAEAATASPAAIDIQLASTVLVPGDTTPILVTLRDSWIRGATGRASVASAGATLDGDSASSLPIRLWPDGATGRLRGVIRAPIESGTYRVLVESGRDTASASLVVGAGFRGATPDAAELLEVWAAARGGALVPASRLDELPGVLSAALEPPARPVIAHPMRSPWWIVVLALALGGEWLWRRRRGLA